MGRRYYFPLTFPCREKMVADNENDLDLGFIIMPDAISTAKLPELPGPEPTGPTEEEEKVNN